MKPLAERLGRDPSAEERFEDIEARLEALEKLADEKEGRPSESGAAKAKAKD